MTSISEEGARWIERALKRLASLELPETDHLRVEAALNRLKNEELSILANDETRLGSARNIAEKMMNMHDLEQDNLNK